MSVDDRRSRRCAAFAHCAPAKAGDARYADPSQQHTLPPQTLDDDRRYAVGEGRQSWAWYRRRVERRAAGRHAAARNAHAHRSLLLSANGAPNFVAHHQPFNYFARFAPGTPDRAVHLKDYRELADRHRHSGDAAAGGVLQAAGDR